MRVGIVLVTTLLSFFSLWAVIIGMKYLGFDPSSFHNPEMIFDPITILATALILLIPILLTLISQKLFLKKSTRELFAGKFVRPMIFGALLGLGLKTCATLLAVIFSPEATASVVSIPVDLATYLPFFLYFILALFLNSASEELVYRAFPLQALWRDNIKFLIFLGFMTAALFSLAHFLIEEPSTTRFFYRFSFGFLAALLYIRSRSLWQIVGLHTGWNFIALSVGDADWRNGAIINLVGLQDGLEGILNSFVLLVICLGLLIQTFKNGILKSGVKSVFPGS